MRIKAALIATIALLFIPAVGSAAFMEYVYHNAYEADEIRFNIVNVTSGADISFNTFLWWTHDSSDAANDWTWLRTDPQSLVFSDPDNPREGILPGTGTFTVSVYDGVLFPLFSQTSDRFDFTLEWSEWLNGSMVAGSEGHLDFIDGEPIPTPIPASAWMLVSGLAIFLGIRRHRAV